MAKAHVLKLQPTGIEGLDQLLGGGVPPGSIILLAGNPGTGKTTMAAQFIYRGARDTGEPGVYLSFVEPKKDFYTYMRGLGMDFEDLEKKGMFYFMEALTTLDREMLAETLERFVEKTIELNARRVVVDSLSALLQLAGSSKEARELIHNTFVRGMKKLGVTTILIAELPIGSDTVGYGVEEFIVDGVIILKMRLVKGRIVRVMELRKMRGAPLTIAEFTFRIVQGRGVELRVPVRMEDVPGIDHHVIYRFGETTLDNLLLGGIPRGSQILFITSPMVDPLFIMTWIISFLAVVNSGRILYRSYIRSQDAIMQRFKTCMENAEKLCTPDRPRCKVPRLGGDVIAVSVNPTMASITDIAAQNIQEELRYKPDFLVIEGLETIYEIIADPETYRREHFNNLLIRKKLGITTAYTFSALRKDALRIPLISAYDSVFYLRPRKRKDMVYIEVLPLRHTLGTVPRSILIRADIIDRCIYPPRSKLDSFIRIE